MFHSLDDFVHFMKCNGNSFFTLSKTYRDIHLTHIILPSVILTRIKYRSYLFNHLLF